MRDAAAAAFKRTYIGQCAETLRPSNQSHVLSAAWTQRQLGPRAFCIHDETRFSAIHARLHWLPLLSRTFTRCFGSACTRPKLARKPEPMPHSSTINEWATGLLPGAATSVKSAQASGAHCVLRVRNHHCFIARMWSIRQSVQIGQFLCRLRSTRRKLRYCPKCFPAAVAAGPWLSAGRAHLRFARSKRHRFAGPN
jgi:hypothetical protein